MHNDMTFTAIVNVCACFVYIKEANIMNFGKACFISTAVVACKYRSMVDHSVFFDLL